MNYFHKHIELVNNNIIDVYYVWANSIQGI